MHAVVVFRYVLAEQVVKTVPIYVRIVLNPVLIVPMNSVIIADYAETVLKVTDGVRAVIPAEVV